MPRRSTFSHYDLTANKKKTLTIETFKGVDYNPAQLEVANNHAVEILNIVFKDRTNQKRKGWEQTFQFVFPSGYKYEKTKGEWVDVEESLNVNGVWTFVAEDEKEHTIIHIGHLLFEMINFDRDHSYNDTKLEVIYEDKYANYIGYLEDTKTTAFVSNKRLYILDGKKYRVLHMHEYFKDEPKEWMLSNVEDVAYIPTTTIGITYKNAKASAVTPLEDVNLLSIWRKNKLVSGIGQDEPTKNYDWELDTSVVFQTRRDLDNIVIEITEMEVEE